MPLSPDAATMLRLYSRASPAVRAEVGDEFEALRQLNTTFRGERFGTQYYPDILADAVTRHVLAQTEVAGTLPPTCPTAELASCANGSSRPPTLVLLSMPQFQIHTGYMRAWALLHVLKYHCLMEALNMRLVVMVQAGEFAGCQRICRPGGRRYCRCYQTPHDRAYNQRNVAEFALGREHILYAHSDVFLNLPMWSRLILAKANDTMLPNAGLHGTTYTPIPSACVPATEAALNRSTRWFWHLDARPKCRLAANGMKPAELGGADGHARWMRAPVCCYGWSDVAFVPMRAQAAFRRAVRNSFWDVQCEVAFPTVFRALQVARVANQSLIGCLGGCCQKVPWMNVRPPTLCAHRTDLEMATINDIPPRLRPENLCTGAEAIPLPVAGMAQPTMERYDRVRKAHELRLARERIARARERIDAGRQRARSHAARPTG